MATRLYFSGSQVPLVSPAFGSWDANTGARFKLLSAKEAGESLSSLGLGGISSVVGVAQFVSEPLSAQTISGTLKAYLRGAADSSVVVTPRLLVKVVSNDGLTLRGTFLPIANYGSGLTFSIVALTSRSWADGDSITPVSVQDGDRLVVEIGVRNDVADDGFIGFGAPSSTSDLPENEIESGVFVPWVEFSATVVFQGAATGAPNLLLLGVG